MGVLPTEKSIPATGITAYRWLIHGWPKTGKTSLAAMFPDPLFLQTEDGCRAISVYALPVDSWAGIKSIAEALHKEEHGYKTVVLDVTERLYDLLCEDVAKAAGVKHISDMGYGAGWAMVNRKFHAFLEYLTGVGLCPVAICHSTVIKDNSGPVEISRVVPNLPASARKVLVGWADVTLYLEVEFTEDKAEDSTEPAYEHVAICKPSRGCEAGGRIRYLPRKLVLSPDPATGFRNLETAFLAGCDRQKEDLIPGVD